MNPFASSTSPDPQASRLRINRIHDGWELDSRQWLPAPLSEVFPFFADAANLDELTPTWLRFEVLTPDVAIQSGTVIDYRLKLRFIPIRWRSEITVWEPPYRFVDEQLRGPYRMWVHEHSFVEIDGGTLVRDHVQYDVPGGRLAHWLFVKSDLEKIFHYRQNRLRERFGAANAAAPMNPVG